MSWELASFLIVAAVVVAGFAWYERSRPPAQVVALVAALAALAIAGRIAFAAFPNVKPTTDIIIFAGYALGGAPGFAVGALTALVSNFWFGQGPWTPWQMAAWGLCGVLGAGLALSGRTPNRFVLAAVCGLAGAGYGALLNFSLMATYGGELSLAHFGVLEARAIPFDAAHAATNFVLALVAGPAMLRMLVRFRERFEWTRRGEGGRPPAPPPEPGRGLGPAARRGGAVAALAIALGLGALVPAPAHAAPSPTTVVWLETVQNADGGWGASPDDKSSSATTDWTMLGLEAAGRNPLEVARRGTSPVDYLRSQAGTLKSPGALARTILALNGAGVDARKFGGENLVATLLGKQRDNGSFEGWPGSTAFAILALRSAGADGATRSAASWLRKVQNEDGGWGDTPGSPSTADGTGASMMALAGSKAAQRGLTYLRAQQRQSGGFPLGQGFPVNTQSTAWAVQGIIAAGGNPSSFKDSGKTPFDYLAANQEPGGNYRYAVPGDGTSELVANQSPIWTTAQVLAAVSETAFPIADVPPTVPKPKVNSPSANVPPPAPPSSSGSAGGVPPASVAPVPAPELNGAAPESSSGGSSQGRSSGGGSISPGKVASPGQTAGAPPSGGEGGLEAPSAEPPGDEAGSGVAEDEPIRTTEPQNGGESDDDSVASVAGAIVAGLLAGCLLFGLGWVARRGWMHWRYGL